MAFSTNNKRVKRECVIVDIAKINKKANFFDRNFNISSSRIVAKFILQDIKKALKLENLAVTLGDKTWDIDKCKNRPSRHYYQYPQVKQSYVLTFEDRPSDYRRRSGEKMDFVTHLVGIKINDTDLKQSQWKISNTFKWQLTNDIFGKSKISLVAIDLPVSELSPALLAQIESDGGFIPTFAMGSL